MHVPFIDVEKPQSLVNVSFAGAFSQVPVVQSNEPVEVFGYLQKKGRRLKAWHQRWFEIRGQHMYYFKSNSVSEPEESQKQVACVR